MSGVAMDDRLCNDHWGLGPSAVVVGMLGKWVAGGLINNLWSVGGSSDATCNQMLIQPFINYNVEKPTMDGDWSLRLSLQFILSGTNTALDLRGLHRSPPSR